MDTHNVPRSEGKQIAFVGRLSHEKKAPPTDLQSLQSITQISRSISTAADQWSKNSKTQSSTMSVIMAIKPIWLAYGPKIGTLVICSRYEGLPMIALEAMTRGIIVIALDVGNLSKLINHNDNGFLFDSFSTLATQFRQLLNQDRPTLDAIRQRAINTVENDYSPQSVIPKLLKIYGSQVEKSDFHFDNSSQSKKIKSLNFNKINPKDSWHSNCSS
ncbi:glycosyltransferase [Vibrio sinaloensis]|nr:glycosyltransferase [Vibrio sinaloensis]